MPAGSPAAQRLLQHREHAPALGVGQRGQAFFQPQHRGRGGAAMQPAGLGRQVQLLRGIAQAPAADAGKRFSFEQQFGFGHARSGHVPAGSEQV